MLFIEGGIHMKKALMLWMAILTCGIFAAASGSAFWEKSKMVAPKQGIIQIPVSEVSDGQARFYKVKADDGITVTFFVVKSREGAIKTAVDACDVCYREGKGYVQKGDYMICENCGQRFLTAKIGVIKGGCNPVVLENKIQAGQVVIAMKDINEKSWYCKYKKQ